MLNDTKESQAWSPKNVDWQYHIGAMPYWELFVYHWYPLCDPKIVETLTVPKAGNQIALEMCLLILAVGNGFWGWLQLETS